MEKVEKNGKLYALILRARYETEGVTFFTPKHNPLQLGVLKYKKGDRIVPHFHKASLKMVTSVQEALHIEYGKVEVEFYDNHKKIGSSILCSGDTILLIAGGHGFKILEDSKILEIKQGPYYGVREDKEYIG